MRSRLGGQQRHVSARGGWGCIHPAVDSQRRSRWRAGTGTAPRAVSVSPNPGEQPLEGRQATRLQDVGVAGLGHPRPVWGAGSVGRASRSISVNVVDVAAQGVGDGEAAHAGADDDGVPDGGARERNRWPRFCSGRFSVRLGCRQRAPGEVLTGASAGCNIALSGGLIHSEPVSRGTGAGNAAVPAARGRSCVTGPTQKTPKRPRPRLAVVQSASAPFVVEEARGRGPRRPPRRVSAAPSLASRPRHVDARRSG